MSKTEPNKNNKQQAGDSDMVDFQGPYGGSVDGWWAPEGEGNHVIKGILANFIDQGRSDKLQSDSIVLELLEDCKGCKNGGSDKMPGEKGDEKLHTAPKGCFIGVPVWKQLEGLWPRKAGFKVYITRSGEKRSIGKGRSMYDIKIQTSTAAVRHVEVFEQPADDAPMAPETEYQVEN